MNMFCDCCLRELSSTEEYTVRYYEEQGVELVFCKLCEDNGKHREVRLKIRSFWGLFSSTIQVEIPASDATNFYNFKLPAGIREDQVLKYRDQLKELLESLPGVSVEIKEHVYGEI